MQFQALAAAWSKFLLNNRMVKVSVYNLEGAVAGSMELPESIFGVAVNPELVHEAVRVLRSESRQVVAHTKTRGEVRGGGKKPWKQKGTGRARHGSIRSPIWKGGGVVFGPRNDRNFVIGMNRKARAKALYMTLSDKAANDQLIVLDGMPSDMKTSVARALLSKLPLKGNKKTLLALGTTQKEWRRSLRNLASTESMGATNLNVYDVLRYPNLVMTKEGLADFLKLRTSEATAQ